MDINVKGGRTLVGEVTPSGYKNSAVALIPASLLFDKPVTLKNVPDITDVEKLVDILRMLGSKIEWDKEGNILQIDNSDISFQNVKKEDLGAMRGSSLLWGPMLARFGEVEFGQRPGGCNLGFRTLSPHYRAFQDLGAYVDDSDDGVSMNIKNAKAGRVWLEEMSPTATENAIMVALGLKGKTTIVNAASEPQVQDLCRFLSTSGAKITGVGTSVVEVEGGMDLTPKEHTIFPDYYEVATYLALSAITGGGIKVKDSMEEFFVHINRTFAKFGVIVEYKDGYATISKDLKISLKKEEGGRILTVKAHPWPGLPVDMLPFFIPLALASDSGAALFHNWMYDAGLYWTSEFEKMGANVVICDPHRVMVVAGNKLKCGTVDAPYIIRAVVALLMAAMIADGETTIRNADAILRGHPHFVDNLVRLGAAIEVK